MTTRTQIEKSNEAPEVRYLGADDADRMLQELWHESLINNPGGITAEYLAESVGCGRSYVYRLGEDDHTTLVRLGTLIALMASDQGGRDRRVLQRIAQRAGCVLVEREALGEGAAGNRPADVVGRMGAVLGSAGELAVGVSKALEDGVVSREEAAHLLPMVSEMRRRLESLEWQLTARQGAETSVREVG